MLTNFSIKTDDSSSGDLIPDITIVKVESAQTESGEPQASGSGMNIMSVTGGLDMHVDDDGGGMSSNQQTIILEEGEDLSDAELEEWAKEEMSNEGSNISGDQSMLQSSFKGRHIFSSLLTSFISIFILESNLECKALFLIVGIVY